MIQGTTLKDCIQFAVDTEDHASQFYRNLSGRFQDNDELSQIFKRLSGDEANHKHQFSLILAGISSETNINCESDKCYYLQAMSTPDFFNNKDSAFNDVNRISERNDALTVALNFEKATLGFYQAIDDIFGHKAPLEEIISAEKVHISNLMTALLVEGSRFRSLDDKWY